MHFLYGIDICYDIEFPLEKLGIIPDSYLPCVVLIIEFPKSFLPVFAQWKLGIMKENVFHWKIVVGI